ncbi:hypothetical protein [Synechococcus sp. PCC 7335]|uniref:hypothetical protein n=1 Tax=Synechococcus sp. (strain ATCC 29403 / PCC 7335) TaxID=91464 RepID=UPI0012FB3217|nr:hypothetical protein [Synechococcus sp. PCC 7335]
MRLRLFVSLAITTALVSPAAAHPGGLNSAGCHAGSQPYHCHRSQPTTRPAPRRVPSRVYSPAPTSPSHTQTSVPALSVLSYTASDSVCIQDGPTNIRTEPNFGDNVRGTLATGSCGKAILFEDGFTLVEYQFAALGVRRYWVHDSQI